MVDIIDTLDNIVDEFITFVNQAVVEFVTLNQEHAHTDFIWSLVLDLLDSIKIDLDTRDILISVSLGVGTEFLNFLWLFKKEKILVVDINGLSSNLQVLKKNLRDLGLGIYDHFVFLTNLPKV